MGYAKHKSKDFTIALRKYERNQCVMNLETGEQREKV